MTDILRAIFIMLLMLFAAYATHTAELTVKQQRLSNLTEKNL